MPGSTSPQRVAITSPSSGVKPIEVSIGRPSRRAAAEQPLPSWKETTRRGAPGPQAGEGLPQRPVGEPVEPQPPQTPARRTARPAGRRWSPPAADRRRSRCRTRRAGDVWAGRPAQPQPGQGGGVVQGRQRRRPLHVRLHRASKATVARRSGPPWTTRWAMAASVAGVRQEGLERSAIRPLRPGRAGHAPGCGAGRRVDLGQREAHRRAAGVDDEDPSHEPRPAWARPPDHQEPRRGPAQGRPDGLGQISHFVRWAAVRETLARWLHRDPPWGQWGGRSSGPWSSIGVTTGARADTRRSPSPASARAGGCRAASAARRSGSALDGRAPGGRHHLVLAGPRLRHARLAASMGPATAGSASC